ncbi:protein eva-1-like isoform X2 [Atheta coriaria]|uniref:protein eva-1-like isoform X2 n=1 Tax=Dalotia coriaria TaxID=877792 RepID=UPI0031F3EF55
MQFFIVIGTLCGILEAVRGNLGTLRTFQAAACDNDAIHLRCPPGTRIAIELARYGRIGNQQHVCPSLDKRNKTSTAIMMSGTCLLPTAQQTVIGLCQTKTECHFVSNATVFEGDPCPQERKYVEVAYKCRPYEFRSRLVCQDERMRLACNTNARIAIFTAIFGRGKGEKDDKTPCASEYFNQSESCFSSYATQTAMQACHGRRTCELVANALTFGQPCKTKTKVYLKVIYTCVPRKVLNKQYEARVVEFTDAQMAPVDKYLPHAKNDLGNAQVYYNLKSSTTTSSTMLQKDTSAILDNNCTVEISDNDKPNKVIGFISQWINTYTFVAQNQERFYLYLILSLGAGVLLCMSLLIIYLLVQRGRARREAKYRSTSYGGGGSILPHGFADDISVVDADIDLDLPIVSMRPFSNTALNSTTASAPCELLRGCHTLPRDMPRSLNAGGGANSSFFYG